MNFLSIFLTFKKKNMSIVNIPEAPSLFNTFTLSDTNNYTLFRSKKNNSKIGLRILTTKKLKEYQIKNYLTEKEVIHCLLQNYNLYKRSNKSNENTFYEVNYLSW